MKRDRVEARAASIVADYAMFGTLDASLRFTRVEGRRPQAPTPQRRDFTLILTNGHPPRASGDGVAGEAGAPPVWKIDGPVPPPRITVDAAIRHVTELRDKTTDDRIRKNAVRALASLKLQK